MKNLILLLIIVTLTGCCKPPQHVDTFCYKYQYMPLTNKEYYSFDKKTKQRWMANQIQYIEDCGVKK